MGLPNYQRMELGRDFQTRRPVGIDRRTALACAAIAAGIVEWRRLPAAPTPGTA